jgi:hypothetical protein
MRVKGKTAERRYGGRHQKLRKAWARRVLGGDVLCARCGLPILPGMLWDLGHHDLDRSVYTGPEHRGCNRGALSRRKQAARIEIWSRAW